MALKLPFPDFLTFTQFFYFNFVYIAYCIRGIYVLIYRHRKGKRETNEQELTQKGRNLFKVKKDLVHSNEMINYRFIV